MPENPYIEPEFVARLESAERQERLVRGLPEPPEYIERDARLFRAGDYPDKGFSRTPDDLDAIIAATQAGDRVPLIVEHLPDHVELGEVLPETLRRAGDWILGRVRLPLVVFNGLKTKGLSVRINRLSNRISDLSLTPTPRVVGAALMSRESDDHIVFTGGSLMPEDVETTVTPTEPDNTQAPVEPVVDEQAERGLGILRRIGAALNFSSRPDPAESTATPAEPPSPDPALVARLEALEARDREREAAFSRQRIAAAVDRRVTPRMARLVETLRGISDTVTFSDGDAEVTLSRDAAADELLEALSGAVPGGNQLSARDVNADLDFSERSADLAEKLRREHPELTLTQAQEQADQLALSGKGG